MTTGTPDASHEAMARDAIEQDTCYLAAVTGMAGRKQVTTTEDICAGNGLMLVARGTTIGSGMHERLLRHKLFRPVDQSLDVADAVSPESLARDASRLIDENAWLARLANRSGDPLAMRHGLARLTLPRALSFKLTVAREQRPALFEHLLAVALISHYVALRDGLAERDTTSLLAAAVLHDLGELHTDPALLDPRHRIEEHEWRHIRVHPITGYLIAREAGGLDAAVLTAILQHHERLDGSGYPGGLRDDGVDRLARIIGLADVCAAILARFGNTGRLGTLMRLNRQKYDTRLLSLLQDGLRDDSAPSPAGGGVTRAQLETAASLLQDWETFRANLARPDGQPPAELTFLFERMLNLRSMLLQFGFDPDSIEGLMELAAEDPLIATELGTALDEMHWQFSDLAREVDSRWNTLLPAVSGPQGDFLAQWRARLSELASLSAPAGA